MHSALGSDQRRIHQVLQHGTGAQVEPYQDLYQPELSCWVGRAEGALPDIPDHLPQYNTRNNRLALSALNQIQADIEQAIATW